VRFGSPRSEGKISCHQETHEGREEFVLFILSNFVRFAIFVVETFFFDFGCGCAAPGPP
jgi:hypothetical protein